MEVSVEERAWCAAAAQWVVRPGVVHEILRLPEVKDNFLTMGADVLISTPAEFAQLIKADLVRYAKLIKDANIRLE